MRSAKGRERRKREKGQGRKEEEGEAKEEWGGERLILTLFET